MGGGKLLLFFVVAKKIREREKDWTYCNTKKQWEDIKFPPTRLKLFPKQGVKCFFCTLKKNEEFCLKC